APECEARIGSAPENDIVLHIKGVSRRHAVVRHCSEGVEIMDQRSTNGLLIAGARIERTVLTPGLRVQIGAAWIEVEEVSSSGEVLAHLLQISSEEAIPPYLRTATVEPRSDPRVQSPDDATLALAYHIARVGVGFPGQRADLLLRIRATLGADVFA